MKTSLALHGASARQDLPLRIAQARNLQLAAQGLLNPSRRRARRDDVPAVIERMRLLQIDSIHVIARSPYMVLFSRLGAYDPAWLDEALERGRIAEAWVHEACFVPAADIAMHQQWSAERQMHWAHRHAARIQREQREGIDEVLAHIREHGAMRTADFTAGERPAGSSGWWSWKPQKRWLEAAFALGDLMVTRRERFQRVYDLAERVRAKLDPPWQASTLDAAGLRRHFTLEAVRALGLTQARWIADYHRLKPAVTDAELLALCEQGLLHRVAVEGWKAPAYVHADHAALLAQAQAGRLRATHTTLLSPFDPLVWDRARVRTMFDFEYTIECYLPQPKRRYGYYVLPILHRGRLIGRLDAKAHREDGVFEVKALYLEADVTLDDRLLDDLAAALCATAQWHETPAVKITRTQPAALARALRSRCRAG